MYFQPQSPSDLRSRHGAAAQRDLSATSRRAARQEHRRPAPRAEAIHARGGSGGLCRAIRWSPRLVEEMERRRLNGLRELRRCGRPCLRSRAARDEEASPSVAVSRSGPCASPSRALREAHNMPPIRMRLASASVAILLCASIAAPVGCGAAPVAHEQSTEDGDAGPLDSGTSTPSDADARGDFPTHHQRERTRRRLALTERPLIRARARSSRRRARTSARRGGTRSACPWGPCRPGTPRTRGASPRRRSSSRTRGR